jgi:hypothetical protein
MTMFSEAAAEVPQARGRVDASTRGGVSGSDLRAAPRRRGSIDPADDRANPAGDATRRPTGVERRDQGEGKDAVGHGAENGRGR